MKKNKKIEHMLALTEEVNILTQRLEPRATGYIHTTINTLRDRIEELKDELVTVVVSVTPGGRERFDTPEIKTDTGKKGRMRKDRYSALVIANMLARQSQREIPGPSYNNIGTVITPGVFEINPSNQMYVGQDWAAGINKNTCFGIRRN